jgi:hypothetical protein
LVRQRVGLLKQGIGPHLSYEGLQQVIYHTIDTRTATPKGVAVYI